MFDPLVHMEQTKLADCYCLMQHQLIVISRIAARIIDVMSKRS